MTYELDSIGYFKRWFVNPINKLKDLPNGDGGFAALMIAIPLYERYIIGKMNLENKTINEESIKEEISKDLNMDDNQRSIFWDMFRNGFMHHAMPKTGKTKWMTSHLFKAIPEFKEINNEQCICFDPWKFSDRVIDKFLENPLLITASESYPLASIFAIPKSQINNKS